MKNIITILAILLLPLVIYSILHKDTASDLSAYAKDNSRPTLMVFTSAMCIDCQKLKTVIKEIEPNYVDKVNFVSVNATEKSKTVKELVKKHNITLVPTVVFLDSKQNEVKRKEGFVPKEDLESDMESLING